MLDEIFFLDTTLRDGEQTPGVNFLPLEKLKIVKSLINLNIPIIELGFPAAGESEIEAIKKIGSEFKNSNTKTVFCVCARAIMPDIEMADKAISNYPYSRIQILMPSSDTHINATLNVSKTKVLEMTRNSIIKAKKYFDDVQFTAIDSLRSNKNFLSELILVAAEAGVNTISLPDSVGFATPYDYYTLVSDIKKVLLNYKKLLLLHIVIMI